MNINDAVHTFVALGNQMSKSQGQDWTSQVIHTERGWGLIASYDKNGTTYSKWATTLLEKEDIYRLNEAALVLTNAHPTEEGYLVICDVLNNLGFAGQVPFNGGSQYYNLPNEGELLVRLQDFASNTPSL